MRQIITLEKEIAFKTMVGEVSSISLEPDLSFINDSEIEGNLVISGTYKMTEASTIEEDFSYKIPVEIMLTTSLEEKTRKVDINNFTYEVVNEESLSITVELLIEGREKIELEEEGVSDVRDNTTSEEIEVLSTDKEEDVNSDEKLKSLEEVPIIKDEKNIDTSIKEDTTNNKVMDSIFEAFSNTEETYSTYSVYILRENQTIDEVLAKYNTNREVLSEYNDLDNLKVGSKLIIPTTIESND